MCGGTHTQIAYNLSLYTLREAAHKFVVSWHETNCDQNELAQNSAKLYTHCLRSMQFQLAADYLFKSCAHDLEMKQPESVLKRLKSADNALFFEWRTQILDELDAEGDENDTVMSGVNSGNNAHTGANGIAGEQSTKFKGSKKTNSHTSNNKTRGRDHDYDYDENETENNTHINASTTLRTIAKLPSGFRAQQISR